MSKDIKIIDELKLYNTEDGKIEIAIIDKPYGEKSDSVISIGIFLKSSNDEPDWKIHLPLENIDRVIESLNKAKDTLK